MIAEVNDYDVAIIGIAGRFPGARNVQEFWTNLRDGVESIRFLTPAELAEGGVDPAVASDPSYVPASSSLAEIDMFDAAFFGYTPRDARLLDPQGRVFLECVWEALENAACDPATFGGRIGVFASQSASTYMLRHLHSTLAPHEFILSANNIQTVIAAGNDFLATRVSYKLNLTGPSVNVQTACSSSLVAVHMARQSVLTGECDVALAGGVSIYLPHQAGYHYQEGMILSPDGHCRPFDAKARGAVFGRGAGVVVLKPLAAALADGDLVLAVIKGSAINNDGAVKAGYTAPSVEGQARVIVEALANAGVTADTIGYVEAHGTGTPQGDPIEIAALVSAFSADRPGVGRCAIGSVKSNIGHLDVAAGVTGLIKTVLMLQHRELPPTLHFTAPNPQIDFASSPFRVNNRLTEWHADGGPRRAGVSAFGIGGTNAHMVLEEAPPVERRRADFERPCHLLTLSAKTPAALRALADRYADHLAATSDGLGDICHTAAIGRTHWNHRAAVLVDTPDRTVERLRLLAQEQLDLGVSAGQAGERPRIAFLFAGQGGQYPGMGRQLYEAQPVYRAAIDRCAASLRHELPRPLLDVMFADADDATIHQTQYTQPALFAVEYAMSELWRSWGLEPAAVIGHSMGEYVAACVAGAISLEEALPLVAARARLTSGAPGSGAMAAVFAPEAVVARAIADVSDRVAIAAVNGPEHVVISGDEALVTARAATFEQAGVRVQRLHVSHGFHSPLMEPVLDRVRAGRAASAFRRAARSGDLQRDRGQVTSTELGRSSYWRTHLRDTVRFSDGIQTLLQQGYRWFLEVGPHPTLTGVARQFVDDPELHWLVSARRGQPDWPQVLDALGALYVAGAPVDWRAFDEPYGHRRVVVPTYAFQRQRYWIDAATRATGDAAPVTLPGRRLRSPLIKEPLFETRVGTTAQPWLQDHCLFGKPVFPATGYIAAALGAALEVAGGYPIAVEDVTLSAPLAPPSGTTCLAHTALTSAGSDTWRFRFFSQGVDAGAEDQWTLHAAGLVRKADAPAASAPSFDDLRHRCAARVDPAEHYADQKSRGLAFGPTFQCLVTLARGTAEALGEIRRPDSDADESAGDWHPASLDCVLQTVIQAVGPADGNERRILVPVAIERVTFYGKAPSAMWAHARVRAVAGDRYRAVVQVFDADGRVVADVDGLVVQRVDESRLLGGTTDPGASWLYQLEWQRDGRFATRGGDDSAAEATEPGALAAEVAPAFASLALAEGLPRYREMLAAIDPLCADYAERAFIELGWQPPVGESVSTAELADRLRAAAQHRRLLERLLEILAEDGRLIREGDRWRVASTLTASPVVEQQHNLLARYPEARIQLTLLGACGEHLARVIRGDVDPLQLLFPNGSVTELEALYQDSAFARVYNRVAGNAAADAIAKLAAQRPVRVLEVGAGTGGTTAYVLPNLPSTGVEYVFTDVSTLFLHKARQKFEQFPFVAYQTLDIERGPVEQGYAPHQFDVIVASNVLHATVDLRRTLGNVKELLASDGLLVFVEGTGPARWVDSIFGLTEGWWKFADTDLRPSHPLLSRARWISLLGEMGLGDAVAFPEVERGEGDGWQAIGIARGPHIDSDVVARRVADCQTSAWLLLADQGGTADALRRALAAKGHAAVLVRSGAAFAETQEGGYIAAPASRDDLRRVLANLREHGREVKGIVDLWPLDAQVAPAAELARLEEAEALACGSALAIVQAVAGGAEQPPRLWIVTRGAQAIGRISPQALPQSLLWGFGRTVAIEHPELSVVRLDLDPDELLGAGVLCEALVNAGAEDQIAVRGGERYVARLARVATPPPTETEDESAAPMRLEISERGVFDNLALAPCERPVPGPGEVVIRVRATGLNFRDVLNALGMYPAPFPPLGGECAGTVEAVGDGVADLRAGDAVVGLAHGSFATFALTRREFLVPKPQTLNFADAATVPVVFLTSAFALHELGRIRAGDRVLIHAAAGGVGLAAVQLARRVGAEVIATAGSEAKRDRLRALGIAHVFDSRSADFVRGVQAATGGRGVDLVLNSLNGDLDSRQPVGAGARRPLPRAWKAWHLGAGARRGRQAGRRISRDRLRGGERARSADRRPHAHAARLRRRGWPAGAAAPHDVRPDQRRRRVPLDGAGTPRRQDRADPAGAACQLPRRRELSHHRRPGCARTCRFEVDGGARRAASRPDGTPRARRSGARTDSRHRGAGRRRHRGAGRRREPRRRADRLDAHRVRWCAARRRHPRSGRARRRRAAPTDVGTLRARAAPEGRRRLEPPRRYRRTAARLLRPVLVRGVAARSGGTGQPRGRERLPRRAGIRAARGRTPSADDQLGPVGRHRRRRHLPRHRRPHPPAGHAADPAGRRALSLRTTASVERRPGGGAANRLVGLRAESDARGNAVPVATGGAGRSAPSRDAGDRRDRRDGWHRDPPALRA